METRPLGITQIGLKRTQQIYLFSSTETGNNTIQPADYDEIYLIRKKKHTASFRCVGKSS